MLRLQQIRQLAKTAATTSDTVATTLNTTATGTNTAATVASTLAQKAWNVVKAVAKEFAKKLTKPVTVAFTGELGAGKTTFIKYLCAALGVKDLVTSPTFTIMNIYEGEMPIYHYDMYRINGADALYDIGFYDYADNGISLVEWSENIENALPDGYIKITVCQGAHENSRIITTEET